MLGVIEGILALILVLFIIVLKESSSKWISSIGFAIIIFVKANAGNDGFPSGLSILLLIGFIGFVLYRQYVVTKQENDVIDHFLKMREKHSLEEIKEIINIEGQLRLRYAQVKILYDRNEITTQEFEDFLLEAVHYRQSVLEEYNLTDEEMSEYYLNAYK